MTDQTVLDTLRNGILELEGLIPWSSNYTFLGTVRDAEHEMLVVYKPTRGERPLWDFPTGTLSKREVAAYVLSEALGWGLVPPTVYREGPHGPGMVQVFIEHDPNEHYFTFREEANRVVPYIVAFDVLANNADRKAGHILRDGHGRFWCIDHGICFHVEPKLRTVLWDLAGQPVPSHILHAVEHLLPRITPEGDVARELRAYLSEEEIAALVKRAHTFLAQKHYPLPGPGRHIPWPMV
nr:SCO1664 family protein [Ardenticatena sp.]